MVDLGYDYREMHDYYLLFERKEDIEEYLAYKKKPKARFKACDYVDFHTQGTVNSTGTNKKNLEYLTIKTPAMLDFKRDDWVYDVKYKQAWKIKEFTTADDGQMKELSLRPRKFTILELVRR